MLWEHEPQLIGFTGFPKFFLQTMQQQSRRESKYISVTKMYILVAHTIILSTCQAGFVLLRSYKSIAFTIDYLAECYLKTKALKIKATLFTWQLQKVFKEIEDTFLQITIKHKTCKKSHDFIMQTARSHTIKIMFLSVRNLTKSTCNVRF